MALKPDIIENVSRYDLWYVEAFPVDAPYVRPREGDVPWRIGLLESVQKEGLRHPILIFGHSPKGRFNPKYAEYNVGRDERIYIACGTNRYWAVKELGWESFPAIISWNKGVECPYGGTLVKPGEFRNYAPKGRIWVQEHAFGWKVLETPEDEFGT